MSNVIREELRAVFSADSSEYEAAGQRVVRTLNSIDQAERKRRNAERQGEREDRNGQKVIEGRHRALQQLLTSTGALKGRTAELTASLMPFIRIAGPVAIAAAGVAYAVREIGKSYTESADAMTRMRSASDASMAAGRNVTPGEGVESITDRLGIAKQTKKVVNETRGTLTNDLRVTSLPGRILNSAQRLHGRVARFVGVNPFMGTPVEEQQSEAEGAKAQAESTEADLRRAAVDASEKELRLTRAIAEQNDLGADRLADQLETETRIANLRGRGLDDERVFDNIQRGRDARESARQMQQKSRDTAWSGTTNQQRIAGGNMGARRTAYASTLSQRETLREQLENVRSVQGPNSEAARDISARLGDANNSLRLQRQSVYLQPDGRRRRASEINREAREDRKQERRRNRFDKTMEASGGLIGGRDPVTGIRPGDQRVGNQSAADQRIPDQSAEGGLRTGGLTSGSLVSGGLRAGGTAPTDFERERTFRLNPDPTTGGRRRFEPPMSGDFERAFGRKEKKLEPAPASEPPRKEELEVLKQIYQTLPKNVC